MISEFTTIDQANDIPDPKHIWVDGNIVRVYTGDDMPITSVELIQVDAWQIRKALNQLGLRGAVDAFVAASDDQDLKDGWLVAKVFQENDPFVLQAAEHLLLTQQQLHDLFVMANSL